VRSTSSSDSRPSIAAYLRRSKLGVRHFAHGLLASIIPVRAVLAGDLRVLYLGWLRCAQSLELADENPEPPVPTGLGTLNASLATVAEFLCIDPGLLAAAADGAAQAAADDLPAAQPRS
jgi:hypothetical protein